MTGDADTGDEAQYAVAAAARDVCRAEGVALAVGLGDNIYENGPESDHDAEFHDKFEKPNSGIDVPWLMVLGNHDCSGLLPGSGGDPSRGDPLEDRPGPPPVPEQRQARQRRIVRRLHERALHQRRPPQTVDVATRKATRAHRIRTTTPVGGARAGA
ncbi:metallophosphoesterase, partial [Streptomyces benahoarensis]|uniref:metallophosphoesterase n=1 Tax=Streptomyces benahoarensis TaxID=2595054 RepID=UPI00203514BA